MTEQATPPGDIATQVGDIVAEQAKIDRSLVKPEATLKDLGVASLDAIEVIFDIEERFDIRFPDQGTNFDSDTVQDLINAVHKAVDAKAVDAKTLDDGASG